MKFKDHKKALILNADYTAIGLVKWQQAIKQDVGGVVRVIDFYKDDKITCSGGLRLPVPAVCILTQYKKKSGLKVPFSRKNVFIRDRLRCQYCNVKFNYKQLTLDHVIPRSIAKKKGPKTPTHWENIVTCCHPCNHKKADLTLAKSGMKLVHPPVKPDPFGFVLGLSPWTVIEKEWIPYLPKFYLDLLDVAE